LPAALLFEPGAATAPRRRALRRIAVGGVAALSLIYQLKVNLMPFHHYYELRDLIAAHRDPRYGYRLEQFLLKTHYGEIYDATLALAQGETSHKALNLIRLYRPDLYARLVHELRRRDPQLNLLLLR
jgi:hypothetical protein